MDGEGVDEVVVFVDAGEDSVPVAARRALYLMEVATRAALSFTTSSCRSASAFLRVAFSSASPAEGSAICQTS